MSTHPQRIVILGGGTAGRRLTRRLTARNGPVRSGAATVTLVDHRDAAVEHPLLPAAVATGTGRPALPFRAPRVGDGDFDTRVARVTGVDTDARVVTTTGGELSYDHLVVALGSVQSDMGVAGVAERAIVVRTPADAAALRARIEGGAAVVVAGGGPAGIALAGCLAEAGAAVTLAERKPRLVTSLPIQVGDAARAALERRGVRFAMANPVVEVRDAGVRLKDDTVVEGASCVWTAGTRALPLVEAAFGRAEQTSGGRLVTDPMLNVRGVESVWAIGDVASVPYLDVGGDCPGMATFALGQADRLARNLSTVVAGGHPKAYRHQPAGLLVAVGAHEAVGLWRGRAVSGRPGWLLWRAGMRLGPATGTGAVDAAEPLSRAIGEVTPGSTPVQLGRKR